MAKTANPDVHKAAIPVLPGELMFQKRIMTAYVRRDGPFRSGSTVQEVLGAQAYQLAVKDDSASPSASSPLGITVLHVAGTITMMMTTMATMVSVKTFAKTIVLLPANCTSARWPVSSV
ncbi:hypothetical protein ZHAS_00010920 [Anopheles sinensis]|uniref:Uncharacterized protein n=1 Tax=Anopheles sinensis TaxID=74873 RepID=A0A084VYV4_ANOSI|nr:hypothetical protein ZHAS_00010920 [Anopheles sinensis]